MLNPAPDPSFDPNSDTYERYVSEHGKIVFQLTLFKDGVVLYSGNRYMSLEQSLQLVHDVSVDAKMQLDRLKQKAQEN